MTYGFNHDAAERSYLKAAELDPDCAMCWWGAALVLGPHVNSTMDPANNAKAWDRAAARAGTRPTRRRRKEQAFIEALSARYAAEPPENRAAARRSLRRGDGQARGDVPGRPRRRDDARGIDDGPAALGLLGCRWPAEGPHGRSRVDTRIGHCAQRRIMPARCICTSTRSRPRLNRRAAWLRRTGYANCCRAPATSCTCRRTSTRASGAIHDAVIANQKAIVADDAYLAICKPGPGRVSARLCPAQPSFPVVRGDAWKARVRSR